MEAGRPSYRIEWYNGVQHLRIRARKAWFGSAFLGIWLILWIWCGGKAAINHLNDVMTPVWLVVWTLMSAGTTLLLLGQLFGVDIIRVHQGELAITRRAGPFARTWRYGTGMIDNLRIDMSHWAGDGADGAQYVPYMKQRWGTVRFDHGAETIHLAPRFDASEAAQITDWLRRRLPVSASC